MQHTNSTTLINRIREVGIGRWSDITDVYVKMHTADFEVSLEEPVGYTSGYRVYVKDVHNLDIFECWFADLKMACEQVVAYTNGDIMRLECGRERLCELDLDWYFFEFSRDGRRIEALHSNDPVSYTVSGCRAYRREWGYEVVDLTTESVERFVPVKGSRRFYVREA